MKTVLYKKDLNENTRYLKIWTTGGKLFQESGILGTDNPVVHSKECTGKNIGKSNETSPKEQAKLEMTSKIKEKLDEGYSESLQELGTKVVTLPMLAKSYNEHKDKVDWSTAYVQPKLDGMRCLGDLKLVSRQGKTIETVNHILQEVLHIDLHLDGELYAHGKNFQENMRLIKKYRPKETEEVKYHVYDIVSELSFEERYKLLSHQITLERPEHIQLVKTIKVISEDELKNMHQQFLAQGYEGSILRWGKEGYLINGRSANLLKYKDFQDISCEIIDITPAEQRPEWGVPTLQLNKKMWINKAGTGTIIRISENKFEITNGTIVFDYPTFRAGTKLSHDERKELLINKKDYIGKTAEIRFFEYSEDGIPRFPVMVGIRLDK